MARIDLRDDEGMGLAELLVSMVLMLVVGAMVTTGLISASRTVRQVDDETRGLGDVRTVTERLSRDLLAARSVDTCLSDPSTLVVWVDYDSDYLQEPDETITWALHPLSSTQYQVTRSDAGGDSAVVGRTLWSDIAFTYDGVALPAGTCSPRKDLTRSVGVDLQYDAIVGSGSDVRHISFDNRLRNAE